MEVEVSELYKIWLILISYVIFMSTLVAFMKKLFILPFDQLETDSSENIDSFFGGL